MSKLFRRAALHLDCKRSTQTIRFTNIARAFGNPWSYGGYVNFFHEQKTSPMVCFNEMTVLSFLKDELFACFQPILPPIMCIGNQGTGAGSRIKGFERRGGRWLMNVHSRYATLALMNEHRTSQSCVFCFQQIVRTKSRTGKPQNGCRRCVDPACPSVKHGFAIQRRDNEAALAIAVVGISAIEHKKSYSTVQRF